LEAGNCCSALLWTEKNETPTVGKTCSGDHNKDFWAAKRGVKRTGKIRSSDTEPCVLFLKCARDGGAAPEENECIQQLELLVIKCLAVDCTTYQWPPRCNSLLWR